MAGSFISLFAATLTMSGKLFCVGGGSTPPEIPKRFIDECGGPNAMIMVIPHAAEDPTTAGQGSVDFLKEAGAKNVHIYRITKPTDAQKAELEKQLMFVKGVWMGGGQQGRIIDRFGKDWARRVFQQMYRRGVNFYGTSAGAMVMSDVMIYGPGDLEGTSRIGPGLGLTQWIIDTHYGERNRQKRLQYALDKSGRKLGLGIDERSWVVIRDDVILERHAAAPRPPRPQNPPSLLAN
jgi:cyanophycinase